MKKKFGALLLAGVMFCTMAACFAGCGSNFDVNQGGNQGENPGGENPGGNQSGNSGNMFTMPAGGFDTETPVEITFYHTMGKALREQLDYQLEEFKKLFPNITVTHVQAGGYDDVRDRIQKEIIAGNQPDVSYCYPDHVALYNRANAVQALNDFLPGGDDADVKVVHADGTEETLGLTVEQKDMFIPGFYEEGFKFADESKMYTLPFAKSTEVLFYDKTFFEEHNIEVPKTWDEMEQVCAKIREIDSGCIPLGYDSEANWFITMCEQYGSPYTTASGDDHYLFDNDTNRAFVEEFKGWYDKGYVTTQEIYGSYTSGLFTATTGQRCYMCIGSSAGAKNQQAPKVDNDYAFEVGIASIPQVHPENPKVISQGPSICIFKNSDPQKVLASWLLVKYLATDVEFQAAFSAESGYMPPLTMDTMKTNEAYRQSLEEADGYGNITALSTLFCLEQANAYYTSPAFVGSSKARDEVGALIQAVFTGSKSIDQAFKEAIEECRYFSA